MPFFKLELVDDDRRGVNTANHSSSAKNSARDERGHGEGRKKIFESFEVKYAVGGSPVKMVLKRIAGLRSVGSGTFK